MAKFSYFILTFWMQSKNVKALFSATSIFWFVCVIWKNHNPIIDQWLQIFMNQTVLQKCLDKKGQTQESACGARNKSFSIIYDTDNNAITATIFSCAFFILFFAFNIYSPLQHYCIFFYHKYFNMWFCLNGKDKIQHLY